MDLTSFRMLFSTAGQTALQDAIALVPREQEFLTHYQSLARRYPAKLAQAALEIAINRIKSSAKFPFGQKLYLTREAFEQASSWEAALYRAGRYRQFDTVLDLGCSAGADLLAIASQKYGIGLDNDPLRLAMAQANLQAVGSSGRASLLQADLTASLPFASNMQAALFFDPARRLNGRRVHSVHDYQPPLEIIKAWLPHYPALGVKISPGVYLTELATYDAGVEFVSVDGELKEAVLWFGPLYTAHRAAALLPGPHTLSASREDFSVMQSSSPRISDPCTYLYEPDPAVLRAGLVRLLADQLDACQLDPDIAYLTADKLQPTPFARAWAVVDWFPYQLKRLRAYLREHNIGQVTVKKRGSPLQPEVLIRDLRLSGDHSCVLFLTHLNGKPIVLIADTLTPAP